MFQTEGASAVFLEGKYNFSTESMWDDTIVPSGPAVLTTSGLPWKDLMVQYRQRNEVEYGFSQLQSDLFAGIRGKSVQKSAEGGLLVNFLSLRLRLSLLEMMKSSGITDEMRIPKLMKVMRKLRITCVGGEWRLNEVTRKQREILSRLGLPLL